MPKVRGNGSGCITKCKDGRKSLYRVSITIGYETDPLQEIVNSLLKV